VDTRTKELFDGWLITVRQIRALECTLELLEFDSVSAMPPANADVRGFDCEAFATIRHELLTSRLFRDKTRALMDSSDALDGKQMACVRDISRQIHLATAVPMQITIALEGLKSPTHAAWEKAREGGDAHEFMRLLEQMVTLTRKKAKALATGEHLYDSLLDLYDPGLTTTGIRSLLDEHAQFAEPLLRSGIVSDASCTQGVEVQCDEERAVKFAIAVAQQIGLDLKRVVFTRTKHPQMVGLSVHDVRIALRKDYPGFMDTLTSVMHETGHALYELGFDPEWWRTPMAQALSYGFHESQAILYERMLGNSRAFWSWCFARLVDLLPGIGERYAADDFYRAVNRVEPGPIRVEADAVTYPIHIRLRTIMEIALVDEGMEVRDIPKFWDDEMERSLGLRPKSALKGWLQDPHWAGGAFGYFPSYAVGIIAAAQFWQQAHKDIPELDEQISEGSFLPLLQWVREKIHRRGRLLTSEQLITEVTGRPLDTKAYEAVMLARIREAHC